MNRTVYIIDDEPSICVSLQLALKNLYRVKTFTSSLPALASMETEGADIVLLDLRLGEENGLEVLERIKRIDPNTEVIMMTAFGSIDTSVNAMQKGAFTYLTKPINIEELKVIMRQAGNIRKLNEEIYYLSDQLESKSRFDAIIGESAPMQRVYMLIDRVKDIDTNVLITGESGTGKEMVATSIWRESDRRDKRFIALNCAAIPESIMESELFGYVKGAFTGADPNGRMGKFELANEGVIFLDEIGDMPLYLQSKLLRVLQERKIVRIGSNQLMDIDVRVIAATNKDLKKMVREKRFREDLYYRLDVIPLRVAPLRERLEDIEDLTLFYSQRFARKFGKKAPRLTEEVMDALKGYRWPGNVRELENAVEYMVNLMGEDGTLDVSMLPEDIRTGSREAAAPTENGPGKQTGAGQILSLRELEKNAIRQALLQCGNHTAGKAMAARKLGIGMATLYRKIQQYGL